jgi:hypothetical protein
VSRVVRQKIELKTGFLLKGSDNERLARALSDDSTHAALLKNGTRACGVCACVRDDKEMFLSSFRAYRFISSSYYC